MAKESFMLVSLKGDKAKKLAQVMANPTCTRILEYLAGKDATESQVSKDLKIPLSTVHYNLQQLVEAKLVVIDEFHYSEKGREVNHYKLANKYIIIAPQEDDSFVQHIRKYIPATVIVVAVGAVLKTMQLLTGTAESASTMMAVPEAAPFAEPAAKIMADDAASGSAAVAQDAFIQEAVQDAASTRMMAVPAEEAMNETVNETIVETAAQPVHTPWWQADAIDYFIIGAFFVLLVILIIETINYWRETRN